MLIESGPNFTTHQFDRRAAGAKRADQPAAPSAGFLPEDPLKGLVQFKQWQTCWLRAIALAWHSPRLAVELMANPREFFAEYCHYEVPETLCIKVKVHPEDEKDESGKVVHYGWKEVDAPNTEFTWTLKPMELTLYLPPAPKEAGHAPVALADYEAIGISYPFTFCC